MMKFIIIDTEYTSWEGSLEADWSGEGQYREVIQCAFEVFTSGLSMPVKRRCLYCKPRLNPILSDYIVDLTGISQSKIDESRVDIEDISYELKSLSAEGFVFLSWGNDLGVVAENLRLYDGQNSQAVPLRWIDVRDILRAVGYNTDGYFSSSSWQLVDCLPPRKLSGYGPHNAAYDVEVIRNVLNAVECQVGLDILEKIAKANVNICWV